jgi:predicted DNA-binding transcriptional regulator YafY
LASGRRHTLGELARDLGVSARTVARDAERLRLSGAPIRVIAGRGGGVDLAGSAMRKLSDAVAPRSAG